METFMLILYLSLIIELLILGWIKFYEDSFFKLYDNIRFWFFIFSGLVGFYTFGKSSVITMTKNNEIIKEVFIGKEA